MADMGRSAGIILLMCLISLSHANRGPEIHTPTIQELMEGTPRGEYAFMIIATDADGDTLTYGMTGTDVNYFNVDPVTGRVTIKNVLDREAQTVLKVTVTATDPLTNKTPKDLTIVVLDANDMVPVFQNAPYNLRCNERTSVGTLLFTATATDLDMGLAKLVKYSIEEVIPDTGRNLFSIAMATGEVTLDGSLNYNTQSTYYQIIINATDGGGTTWQNITVYQSSIAYAFITVVDDPDLDPQFINLPYSAAVEEGSPVGQSVFKVLAIDQDRGINDDIVYTIEDSTAEGLFEINPVNGEISVKDEIDRETIGNGGFVSLTVKATEANQNIHGVFANTTAKVQITILDINDNKPEFCVQSGDTCVLQESFTGEIMEHSSGSIPLNITVRDKDQGGKIQLSLVGADRDVFAVVPVFTVSESAVQLMVKNPLKLDFEKKEFMVVKVIAEDQDNTAFHSTATVTIAIQDANDNSPTFSQETYRLQVPEHSPTGTVLGTIVATDLDKLDEGKLNYTLLPNSIRKYFNVEPNTGTIFVVNSSLINREVMSLHFATLQARDSINGMGTAVLEITLLDINDQPPVMNPDKYFVPVSEGEQVQLQIQAFDADDPTSPNSQIVYSIMQSDYSDNFTIDPKTGVLTNNVQLDLEAVERDLKGKIELVVVATDQGDGPLNDTATVIIDIRDINDNVPEFKAASYKFSVKERAMGAFVGAVYAEDLDQTAEFNRISFSITRGSLGSFSMRSFLDNGSYRGDISLDAGVELDYESRKVFTLQVEAANLDQAVVVEVEVEVIDVNDERPEFNPTTATIQVHENNNTANIGHFTAQDQDGNHSLVFKLESTRCLCNSSWKPCNWFLLEDTGEINTNPEITVDYELCKRVQMEAQVVDEFTEKGANDSATSGEIMIEILDTNDNYPEFLLSTTPLVVVSESASKDTSIAECTATDRDSGLNRVIRFSITDIQFEKEGKKRVKKEKIFEVITTLQNNAYVGLIQSQDQLDTEEEGKYVVTMVATDKDGAPDGLSTETVLEIFTIIKSFKSDVGFDRPLEEVQSKEFEIRRDVSRATKADVQIMKIRKFTRESRSSKAQTIMEAYFIYRNGTALNSSTVTAVLSLPENEYLQDLYGLTYIGNVAVDDPKLDPVIFGLLGLVGGMIIVLAVLTTSLVCTRRSYRTKLKAANAMKSAALVTTETLKSGPVVPGTNKYTMEGANPVLNLNIDSTTDLGFDEEGSNVDKISLNSLDYNMDMSLPEKDTLPMRMIQEEDEDSGEPDYIEPLGAALAQRGLKKGSGRFAFDNPAMSTTDL